MQENADGGRWLLSWWRVEVRLHDGLLAVEVTWHSEDRRFVTFFQTSIERHRHPAFLLDIMAMNIDVDRMNVTAHPSRCHDTLLFPHGHIVLSTKT